MYQSTNENYVQPKKQKKSHFIRNLAMSTFFIVAMMLIITYLLIMNNYNKKNSSQQISQNSIEETKAELKDDGIRGLTLKSKYNQNDLKQSEMIEYEAGGVASSASYYGR